MSHVAWCDYAYKAQACTSSDLCRSRGSRHDRWTRRAEKLVGKNRRFVAVVGRLAKRLARPQRSLSSREPWQPDRAKVSTRLTTFRALESCSQRRGYGRRRRHRQLRTRWGVKDSEVYCGGAQGVVHRTSIEGVALDRPEVTRIGDLREKGCCRLGFCHSPAAGGLPGSFPGAAPSPRTRRYRSGSSPH